MGDGPSSSGAGDGAEPGVWQPACGGAAEDTSYGSMCHLFGVTWEELSRRHQPCPPDALFATQRAELVTVPHNAVADWRWSDDEFIANGLREAEMDSVQDVLRKSNSTALCDRIVFLREGHLYLLDGCPLPWSCTTFCSQCCESFDAVAVSERLAGNPCRAVELNYVREDGDIMTAEEMREQWARKGQVASNRGTLAHWHAEILFNPSYSLEPPWSPEVRMIETFRRHFLDRLGLRPIRTEMNVFDERLRLGGQIDLLCVDGKGRGVVFDWKRTASLQTSFRKMQRSPLAHLEDSKMVKYELQLNTYAMMLRHTFGLEVSGMYLVVVHPSQSPVGPHVHNVRDLQAEVATLRRLGMPQSLVDREETRKVRISKTPISSSRARSRTPPPASCFDSGDGGPEQFGSSSGDVGPEQNLNTPAPAFPELGPAGGSTR